MKCNILIYGNGHNDLQPYLFSNLQRLKENLNNIHFHNEIQFSLQVGMLEDPVLSLFEKIKGYPIKSKNNFWSDSKRFIIKEGSVSETGLEGKVNFASPIQLEDFLNWGLINNNNATNYNILLLGGHSIPYIGTCFDYSLNGIQLMSIPQLARAIKKACQKTGNNIDLLILDSCYMNNIETIFEFSDQNNFIKNIITYYNSGPLEGLSFIDLLDIINRSTNKHDIIYNILNNINYNLISINLDFNILNKMYDLINQIGIIYFSNKDNGHESKLKTLKDALNKLINKICHTNFKIQEPVLNYANEKLENTQIIKFFLAHKFCQKNLWANYITKTKQNIGIINKSEITPYKLDQAYFIKILEELYPLTDKKVFSKISNIIYNNN